MANTDSRFGLKPVGTGGAGAYNGRITPYYITSGDSALYVGDPVVKTGTSNTAVAGEGKEFGIGTLPTVTKATAGATNKVTGAIVGFQVDPDNLDKSYNPASTARVVLVADDPHAVFEIQASSDAAVAATDIGTNADLIYTHGGSTVTGLSGAELDTSDMAADATYQLTILGLAKREDNEIGTHSKLLVRINTHTEDNNIVGV